MADSVAQRDAEIWVRESWLSAHFKQPFTKQRLDLRSGGQFEFDAVSRDGSIVVSISTSGGIKADGKKATPKLNKIRSDALFLLLANVPTRTIAFTDAAMYALTLDELKKGRFPTEIDLLLAEVPEKLEERLRAARASAADEVTPRR